MTLARCFIISNLLLALCACNSNPANDREKEADCAVCSRISRFDTLRKTEAAAYWPEFSSDSLSAPLFYFTEAKTYVFKPQQAFFTRFRLKKIACSNGLLLYELPARYDKNPFHMENRMNISEPDSAFYFSPSMFCCDVEGAKKRVANVKNTEEWLGMVLHEYFHSFQFSHRPTLSYLADSIQMSADTLDSFYRNNKWFENAIYTENEWLLKAIAARARDSAMYNLGRFYEARESRRKKFRTLHGPDLAPLEDFWERIEGTARYNEYYLAYTLAKVNDSPGLDCDPLYGHLKNYKNGSFLKMPWMYKKTEVYEAYYYATGFNLCRLLDKYNIPYKTGLFTNASASLYKIVKNNLK